MAFLSRTLFRPLTGLVGLVRNRELSTTSLIEFCRSIRFYLTSGMTLRDAMQALSEKGTRGIRRVAGNIAEELNEGWTFETAIERQGQSFPQLFTSLATVGEETGKLPEVMKDLEKYYELQQKQRRLLNASAFKPLIQFVMAVLVVAGLIAILAELPQPPDKLVRTKTVQSESGVSLETVSAVKAPYDVIGIGLYGRQGAILLIVYVIAGILVMWLLFKIIRAIFNKRAFLEQIILALPFVGSCSRALALSRFSFAMQLMLDSSMSILKTMRLAFAATDNAAFTVAGPRAETHLRRGNTIVTALEESKLFPDSYISATAVGEQTGHLPEVMTSQAEHYEELAHRRITALYTIVGYLVWVGVAAFIAFLVLRLVSVFYLGAIEESQSILDKRGGLTTAP